jgi:G3E family GTPase
MKNFGEFFNDQIEHAGCIYFSHTDKTTQQKLSEAVELVRKHNASAELIVTPADKLTIEAFIQAFEKRDTLDEQLKQLVAEESCPVCGGHHHEHHHHDHDDECCEHHHEHHHHDHKDECHDEHCHCHEHEHHHHEHEHHHHEHEHHHHHADEVFTSWGRETVKKYTKQRIEEILGEFGNEQEYGLVIRSKGIVEDAEGKWIYFDYVPGEIDVRTGKADVTGRFCVIGAKLNEENLNKLFAK